MREVGEFMAAVSGFKAEDGWSYPRGECNARGIVGFGEKGCVDILSSKLRVVKYETKRSVSLRGRLVMSLCQSILLRRR